MRLGRGSSITPVCAGEGADLTLLGSSLVLHRKSFKECMLLEVSSYHWLVHSVAYISPLPFFFPTVTSAPPTKEQSRFLQSREDEPRPLTLETPALPDSVLRSLGSLSSMDGSPGHTGRRICRDKQQRSNTQEKV